MKKSLLIPIFLLFSFFSFGQTKPLDVDEIKDIVKTDAYQKLYDRYLKNDTNLSIDDYTVIYYGQAFKKDFHPYSRHDSIDALNKYFKNNRNAIDFNKVLEYTNLIIEKFPFSIEQIYLTGVSHDKLGNKELSKIWFFKYDKLIRTIIAHGNGKSEETAMVVITVKDEYAILDALGLKFTGQSLVEKKGKRFDVMSVAENDLGIDKLYFNIDLFFGKF